MVCCAGGVGFSCRHDQDENQEHSETQNHPYAREVRVCNITPMSSMPPATLVLRPWADFA